MALRPSRSCASGWRASPTAAVLVVVGGLMLSTSVHMSSLRPERGNVGRRHIAHRRIPGAWEPVLYYKNTTGLVDTSTVDPKYLFTDEEKAAIAKRRTMKVDARMRPWGHHSRGGRFFADKEAGKEERGQAREAVEAGNLEKAITHYQLAITQEPYNVLNRAGLIKTLLMATPVNRTMVIHEASQAINVARRMPARTDWEIMGQVLHMNAETICAVILEEKAGVTDRDTYHRLRRIQDATEPLKGFSDITYEGGYDLRKGPAPGFDDEEGEELERKELSAYLEKKWSEAEKLKYWATKDTRNIMMPMGGPSFLHSCAGSEGIRSYRG